MSVQEKYLADIASAIREKDGTDRAIPANTFAERIRAIKAGGGGFAATVNWSDAYIHYAGYMHTAGLCVSPYVASYEILGGYR